MTVPAARPRPAGDVTTGIGVGWLLLVLASLSMLGPFSIDTPLPAYASMRADFAVSSDQMQYVVSAYLIAFGVMSPFHGPLSDAIGRKPVILGGVGIYVLASVGAAFSTDLTMLLVFRVLQGLSAGGGVIVGRTIIRDLFDGARAQQLMSQVMMLFSLAPAVAPIIGGALLQVGSWHVVFWFMAAAGTVMVVLVATLLPESHPVERRQPLRVGSLLGSLLAVSRSGRFHRIVWTAGLVFGAHFLYVGAAAIVMVDLLGRGELDFWMLFVPIIVGIAVGSWLSGRAAGRIPGRRLVTISLLASLVAAALNLALAATGTLPWVVLGPAFIAASAMLCYPTLQLALLDLFPEHRGAAVSMFSFCTLLLNGLTASLITPLVTDSMFHLALCAAAQVVIAALLWAVHLRMGPAREQPAPEHG